MLSVLRKTKNPNLPVDMQFQILNCMIEPILLYDAEMYGYEKSEIMSPNYYNFIR